MFKVRRIAGVAIVLTLFAALGLAQELKTPAEAADYQKGGTLYGPLMDFVTELESRTELMNVRKITETLLGRDVVLCILSNPPVYGPADVAKTGKPVVLIVNNVHGGEVAGKDASLEIMRDLVMGDLRPLLDKVVVLNIPSINPDGAEVRRRTNEQNFDMNRDYLKLESQEISGLVTRVINTWKPDLHIDTHHGGAAPYALVYQTCMNPAGDPELIRIGNEEILPRVRAGLRAEDYDGFWYSGGRWVGEEVRWSPTSVEPRKQHVYSTLANMVGFLFETPSNSYRVTKNGAEVVPVPNEERYRHQVRGQYIGQREMIRFAAEKGVELKEAIAGAKTRAIALGNDDGDGDLIPIEYEQVEDHKEELWIGKRGGKPGEFVKVVGSVHTKFSPTKTAVRPWAYLMPPSLAKLVPLLAEHEISVLRLSEPVELEVESYTANEISHDQYFQGHYLKKVKAEKKTETVKLPAGSFMVPTGQAKSNLICYLFEPETDDNLVTWGYLDDFLQVTPDEEEMKKRLEEQLEERRAEMTEEAVEQMRQRMMNQGRRFRSQRIPLYRLMKKANVKAVLVEPFNGLEKTRYLRD
jgi:hypothetical protein